jgi:hypothetical protein
VSGSARARVVFAATVRRVARASELPIVAQPLHNGRDANVVGTSNVAVIGGAIALEGFVTSTDVLPGGWPLGGSASPFQTRTDSPERSAGFR